MTDLNQIMQGVDLAEIQEFLPDITQIAPSTEASGVNEMVDNLYNLAYSSLYIIIMMMVFSLGIRTILKTIIRTIKEVLR